MTLDELKQALLAADPAAVLVPPHLLGRVIRAVHGLSAQTIQVPHRKSCILDRQVLFRHVEPDDLDLGPDRRLPETVILLARPSLDRRNSLERTGTLLTYWRQLFHANIHLELERRAAEGRLGPTDVAARVERLGRTEFEEIRAVLDQERYLFPDADDRAVYIEFAAVYLDLRWFMPDVPSIYFPGIRDFRRVDEVLAGDLDAHAIYQRTRLAGVTGPLPRPDEQTDEPTDYCVNLIRQAKRAARSGNDVRAAILRTRAARIAPAALTLRCRADALEDLRHLTNRLQAALKLSDTEVAEWMKDLPALIEKTGDEHWSIEARLLYDLQKACVDNERDVFALDLVEWALSFGKRPIKRPLPSQRIIRITRHLRNAAVRLPATRLSDADRQHLRGLLHDALRGCEERLRTRFRPVLADALHDVGLHASNAPEETAFRKMIEEVLDRITAIGFFTYSDLRDAISRNNLKLPDLADAREYIRGDPLLQLDRRLATALDGVYRPSEVYLRLIQRLTAPNFGTRVGRWITRYITWPFGGALVLLELLELILREYHHHFGGGYRPIFGPLSVLLARLFPPPDQTVLDPATLAGRLEPLATYIAPGCLLLLGWLLMALFYLPDLRRGLKRVTVGSFHLGRWLLIDGPTRLLAVPAIRYVRNSLPLQLFYGLLLKPLVVCALLYWVLPEAFDARWKAVGLFLALAIILNSRPGLAAGDALLRGMLRVFEWLHSGLLPGLVRIIIRVFKQLTDGVEYVLYTVDEWLRFKSGDSRLSMVVRVLLGVIWFPVSYLARLYIVVLIEPGFNPLKAPISILAAKFVYPLILTIHLTERITPLLDPLVGSIASTALTVSTLWLLPDAFGFFFWETKENWKLYRANRRRALGPVSIGPHGETLLQLLKPGFHSGTLPKLYNHWRRAERQSYETGSWRAARSCRESLQELETCLRRFVEREALVLLQQTQGWQQRPLSVGAIGLATNVVRIELAHADFADTPLRLAIAEENGLLTARIEQTGWLLQLDAGDLATITRVLAGLYKLAGVDRFQGDGLALPQDFARQPIAWRTWVDEWRPEEANGQAAPTHTEAPALPPA
jgi:hypothetical protein